MKLSKKIVALAMLTLMLFSLCACGKDEASDALKGTWTRSTEVDGDVSITFDGKGGCEVTWALGTDKGTYTIDSDRTASVKLDLWSESQTFTYEVSDTALKISDNYSIFSGDYTKK